MMPAPGCCDCAAFDFALAFAFAFARVLYANLTQTQSRTVPPFPLATPSSLRAAPRWRVTVDWAKQNATI